MTGRSPDRRLSTNTKVGLAGLGLLVLVAIVAPPLLGDEAERTSEAVRQGASWAHPLGTDALGRDMLARTLVATRLTLAMAAGATAIAVILGSAFGAALALASGRTAALGDRVVQLMIAFPPILVAIAVVAVVSPGPVSATVAIGLAFTPAFARMTNTLARSVSTRDHVTISRLLGRSHAWVVTRHLLPNMADTLLVLISVAFASSVVALSALGFLGLGVQPPSYDWGGLLSTGLQALYTNPIEAVGPAVCILLTGLVAGLLGDGVAVALAPGRTPAKRDRRAVREARGRAAPAAPREAIDGLAVERLRVVNADGDELVHCISFHVSQGEIVGIVGESGSGKTLTALSIAKLLPATLAIEAERLQLGDLDLLGDAPPQRLARELAMVFQDPSTSLNPLLRIGTQMTEVERIHGGREAREARRSAVEALRAVRIPDPEGLLRRYPHELSGGMRQRVMLATALMGRPRLLIADEPTTALDVTVQADVIELLREANSRAGTTILFISHDIAVVAQLCQRILVMHDGRIVEEVSVEQLRHEQVDHPYTRALLAATPRLRALDGPGRELPDAAPQPVGSERTREA